MEQLTGTTKSVVIPAALLRGHISKSGTRPLPADTLYPFPFALAMLPSCMQPFGHPHIHLVARTQRYSSAPVAPNPPPAPAQALAAARVEEDFQAEEWGRVEAGHDLDEADLRSRVFGPSLFVRLLQMR